MKIRVRKRKDRFCEYYGLKEHEDHKVRCPICDKPINLMMEHITRSPIDRYLYHTDCLLKDYWEMKGHKE